MAPASSPTLRPIAWLTYDEAAAYLVTSTRTLRRLVHDRRIGFTRFGGEVRFRREDLDAYVASCTYRPIAEVAP